MRRPRSKSEVTLDFPDLDLELKIPEKQLMGAVARKMATATRKKIRSGVTTQGSPIKPPRDGGRPLRESGQLIKSIKGYAKRQRRQTVAVVSATGTRTDLGASLRGRNAGLLGVQIHGRRREADRPRNPRLLTLTKSLRRIAEEEFDKQLERAFRRGKASIVRGDAGSIDGLAARALGD